MNSHSPCITPSQALIPLCSHWHLDQLLISFHVDLCWVSFLRRLLRGGPATTPQQLFLLSTYFLNQVVSDILQDWILRGQALVRREKKIK